MIGVNYLKPVQKYCKNSVVKNLLIGYLNKYSKKKNLTIEHHIRFHFTAKKLSNLWFFARKKLWITIEFTFKELYIPRSPRMTHISIFSLNVFFLFPIFVIINVHHSALSYNLLFDSAYCIVLVSCVLSWWCFIFVCITLCI